MKDQAASHSLSAYLPPGHHRLPPLPYPYNALEPYISTTTVQIHHDRHHLSYVQGLNNAEVKLAEARQKSDFSLVKHWERELAFHGSGHILHSIYWTTMGPGGIREPFGLVRQYLEKYFGSWPIFREQFTQAAVDVEASGWALLVWQPFWRRLEILTAEKHQDLTQWGVIPVLVLDLWEHAYYLDYQNRRRDYVEAWWHLVDWSEVEKRLQLALPARVPLGKAHV
ncbi:superoxide dismutase [Thermanaeromonas sp. C210]|uniref:superoxide dismutase n=1 Tax=Thermanaeromonas sp. C210 TaxID=2731925 RepID=UPI00155BB917|nr:superoxide dismutase [Thermanaeromonas sp. C210]GFN22182.1 superoxide dismutase [Thermanaeromonas sp. C210]